MLVISATYQSGLVRAVLLCLFLVKITDIFRRLPCASPNVPMDPGFPGSSGFLAWKKVPVILTVPKIHIYLVVNESHLILHGAVFPELNVFCKDALNEYVKVSGQFRDLRRPFHAALTRDTEEMLKALLYMLKIKDKTSRRALAGG